MSTEETHKDFKFRSSPLVSILTRATGLAVIWVAIGLVPSWRRPSSLVLLPFCLLVGVAGSTLLLDACDIEILDGQFRFRRLFTWNSVPLESITMMRHQWLPSAMFIRVDYAGKRYRLLFAPEDFKVHLRPLPVIQFLRDVCRRNAENAATRP